MNYNNVRIDFRKLDNLTDEDILRVYPVIYHEEGVNSTRIIELVRSNIIRIINDPLILKKDRSDIIKSFLEMGESYIKEHIKDIKQLKELILEFSKSSKNKGVITKLAPIFSDGEISDNINLFNLRDLSSNHRINSTTCPQTVLYLKMKGFM